jgi:hypothetical protein
MVEYYTAIGPPPLWPGPEFALAPSDNSGPPHLHLILLQHDAVNAIGESHAPH